MVPLLQLLNVILKMNDALHLHRLSQYQYELCNSQIILQ
jgi:hypothetical protein